MLTNGRRNTCLSLFVCLFVASCYDTVTSTYPDMASARADRLFERGWLPDVLPESTTNIRTSNDLDINISEGEFTLAPKDTPVFQAKLNAYSKVQIQFAGWEKAIDRAKARGDFVGTFIEDRTSWVFICRKNRCEYLMRLESQPPPK